MNSGLLLINLGTPERSDVSAVRRYLREFLADKRVVTLPAIMRYLLLYGIILPIRAKKSAHAYQSIWTKAGSPLLLHSQNLVDKLQHHLGDHCKVVLGMRYGKPNLAHALEQLKNCHNITILPLYPQYSSAATGSSIEKVLRLFSSQVIFSSVKLIRDFHSHPAYITAQAAIIKPYLQDHDYLLFSYHGLPKHHLHLAGCKKPCIGPCPTTVTTDGVCYRAQCCHTSAQLAKALNLNEHQYSTAFQSRLGKTSWIEPYTDETLSKLIAQGIKRLAIACPSFVADCLETLEEIGIRAKQEWFKMGGTHFTLIPSLNDNDQWVEALVKISDVGCKS